mmetsp:Transcript_30141/g.47248  ORF Transcript_30141/g.47248 Transcript_30141/m.47248 type:complete len:431 (+) Transcript_30141:171-1463(+)
MLGCLLMCLALGLGPRLLSSSVHQLGSSSSPPILNPSAASSRIFPIAILTSGITEVERAKGVKAWGSGSGSVKSRDSQSVRIWETAMLRVSGAEGLRTPAIVGLRGGGRPVKMLRGSDSEVSTSLSETSEEEIEESGDSEEEFDSKAVEKAEKPTTQGLGSSRNQDWASVVMETKESGFTKVTSDFASKAAKQDWEIWEGEDEEHSLIWDRRHLGRSMRVLEDGVTLKKLNTTTALGKELGYPLKDRYDKEGKLRRFPLGTFALWGPPEPQKEVSVYHLLVEHCQGSNFFVGLAEPPIYPTERRAMYIKTRAWMVVDGGELFRTGPDIAGPGYLDDDPDYPVRSLRHLVKWVIPYQAVRCSLWQCFMMPSQGLWIRALGRFDEGETCGQASFSRDSRDLGLPLRGSHLHGSQQRSAHAKNSDQRCSSNPV